jgi:hypothetical protein
MLYFILDTYSFPEIAWESSSIYLRGCIGLIQVIRNVRNDGFFQESASADFILNILHFCLQLKKKEAAILTDFVDYFTVSS